MDAGADENSRASNGYDLRVVKKQKLTARRQRVIAEPSEGERRTALIGDCRWAVCDFDSG